MKRLDMTDVCVIYAGEGWRHRLPPCSKEMMSFLERNEKLVSWLQPFEGNSARSVTRDQSQRRILHHQPQDDEGDLAACQAQERVRECRAGTLWGPETQDSRDFAGGKAQDAV